MDNYDKILKELQERERWASFKRRCMDMLLCPKCGSNLNKKIWGHQTYEYVCQNKFCNFRGVQ
jgi:hypothetical protein